jgi:hypothetical protein
MVLGIITAIAACPAIVGTTEAVRQGQYKSAKEKHRGAKTNLVVSCVNSEIDGRPVVLRDGRVRHLHSFPRLRCLPVIMPDRIEHSNLTEWPALYRFAHRYCWCQEPARPPLRRLLPGLPRSELGPERRRARLDHQRRPTAAELDLCRRCQSRRLLRTQSRGGGPHRRAMGLYENR